MRIGRFLSLEPLQIFMVEKGLNPEVIVHSKSLELLGQREVSEDHVMNLGRNKSVFNQMKTRFVTVIGHWIFALFYALLKNFSFF